MSKELPVICRSGDLLKEEKNITWIINNFSLCQEMHSPKNEAMFLEFEAGESIKRHSKWRLELRFTSTNEIGFYLKLKDCSAKPDEKLYTDYFFSIILDPNNPNDNLLRWKAGYNDYTNSSTRGLGWAKFRTVDQLRNDLGALVDDTLILHVEIVIRWVRCTSILPSCTPEILNQNEHNEIRKQFGVLLETGEDSDFVIRVKKLDSEEYIERKVHRTVLSARSPVFKAMLNTGMMEKETGSVTIEDLSPKGLNVLLEFIYTGNLHDDWKLVPGEIINAAEKYDFPQLKTYGDQWLHTVCTKDNALTLLILADTHGLLEAYKNISLFIKTNHDNILSSVVSNTHVDNAVDRSIKKTSNKCLIV